MSADLLALLDQLDEARENATPGPWQVVVSGGTDLFTGESYREVEIDFNDPVENAGLILGEHELAGADAALIVAAVNALPQLTAALRGCLRWAGQLDREALALGAMQHDLHKTEAAQKRDAAAGIRGAITAALTPEGGAR